MRSTSRGSRFISLFALFAFALLILPASFAPDPSGVWSPTVPTALASHHGLVFVLERRDSDLPTIVAKVDAYTGQVHAELDLSFLSGDPFTQSLAVSDTSLFVFVSLNAGKHSYVIAQIDIVAFTLQRTLSVPEDSTLYGASPSGSQLLVRGDQLASLSWIDSLTGRIIANLTGGLSGLVVVGGAHVTGTRGDVLVSDYTGRAVSLLRANNSVAWSWPWDNATVQFGSVVVNDDGRVAYAHLLLHEDRVICSRIIQLNVSSGERMASSPVLQKSDLQPALIIAPATSSPSVFVGDVIYQDLVLLRLNDSRRSHFALGRTMPGAISQVKTRSGERVYVSLTVSYNQTGFVALNATGYPVRPPTWLSPGCVNPPDMPLAITSGEELLVGLCNGTLLLFDSAGVPLRSLDLGNHTQPVAMALSPDDRSVFVVSAWQTWLISQIDLASGKLQQTIDAGIDASIVDVAVAAADGSLWALLTNADNSNSSVAHWSARGSLLSDWPFASANRTVAWSSLALDPAHRALLVGAAVGAAEVGVLWLDEATGAVTNNFTSRSEQDPAGVAVTADGSTAYAAFEGDVQAIYLFRQNSSSKQHTMSPA